MKIYWELYSTFRFGSFNDQTLRLSADLTLHQNLISKVWRSLNSFLIWLTSNLHIPHATAKEDTHFDQAFIEPQKCTLMFQQISLLPHILLSGDVNTKQYNQLFNVTIQIMYSRISTFEHL